MQPNFVFPLLFFKKINMIFPAETRKGRQTTRFEKNAKQRKHETGAQ